MSSKNQCDVEIKKEQPNVKTIQIECSKIAQDYQKKNKFLDASWYFLLSKDLNNSILYSTQAVDSKPFAYIKLAHAQYLIAEKKDAKENYIKFYFLLTDSDKYFKEDIKVLKKLYGKKKIFPIEMLWEYAVKQIGNENIQFYKAYAGKGNIKAQKQLAEYFYEKKKFKDAQNYYELLEGKGDKNATKYLKYIALERGESDDKVLTLEYAKHLEKIYDSRASIWYEKAAYLDNEEAQQYLAKIYWERSYEYNHIYKKIIEQDLYEKALYWNLILAKKGDMHAQIRLIDIYCSSLYGLKDIDKAKEWGVLFVKQYDQKEVGVLEEDKIFKAVEEEIIVSPYWIYQYAKSLKYKNELKSILWYKKAAEIQWYDAYKELAKFYKNKGEYDSSLLWYNKLDKSDQDEYFLNELKEKIYESKLVSGRDDIILLRVANNYFEKARYDSKKYKKALSFYKKIDRKSLYVLYKIGMVYKYLGSYKQSEKYFLQIAKQNYIDGCKELTFLYNDNKYDMKNRELYRFWSKKTSELTLKYQNYKVAVIDAIHMKNLNLVKNLIENDGLVDFEFVCEATKDGNIELLEYLDNRDPFLDWTQKCSKYLYRQEKGEILLYYAALFGYEDISQYLLEKNIFRSTKDRTKALRNSFIHGNNKISQQLLDKNTPINFDPWIFVSNDYNYKIVKQLHKNSLSASFEVSSYEIFKSILKTKKKKVFYYKNELSILPLFSHKYIKLALQNGLKIEKKKKLLRQAAQKNDIALAEILIKQGVNVDREKVAFQLFVMNKEYKIIEMFLEHSKNPISLISKAYGKYNYIDDLKIVKLFFKYGLDKKNPYLLSSSKKFQVMKLLIDNGVKIPKDSTVLHQIINQSLSYEDMIKALEYLIDHGASPNTTNYAGDTLIEKLISKPNEKNRKIIRYLVTQGLDLNQKNFNHSTVLQQKILARDFKNVKFLLDLNVIPIFKDFQLVMHTNQIEIFSLLIQYNTQVDLHKLLEEAQKYELYEITKIIELKERS